MEPKVLHLGVRGSTPSPPHWDWEASRSRFRRGSPSMQHRKMHKPWWSQCVKFATHNNDDSNDGLGHALVATLEIGNNHTFCKVFEHLNRLMMLWSDWKSSEQGKRVPVDANGSQTLAISASLQGVTVGSILSQHSWQRKSTFVTWSLTWDPFLYHSSMWFVVWSHYLGSLKHFCHLKWESFKVYTCWEYC